MFYNKYRPQKFSEIIRPNTAADGLSKQIQTNKTAHAYLFIGPRGTGKTATARILAKALNCDNPQANGDPCCECGSCVSIANGAFLDLIEIDAASNRGIDDIRELKSKINLAPTHGKHKVYIVDEVHMLTKEAFNALLKTLEEPPAGVTFILCTTESNKVPDTIKSRCQIYRFKRAGIPQLVEKMNYIVSQEGADISEDDLRRIAQASLGGFRDAETLLQQVLEGELSVESFSGLETYDGYIKFTKHLQAGEAGEAVSMIDEAFEEGVDLYVWVGEFLRYLRDMLFLKSGVEESLLTVTDEIANDMKKLAISLELGWTAGVLNEFMAAQDKIREAFIPQLPIELAVYRVCYDVGSGLSEEIPSTAPGTGPAGSFSPGGLSPHGSGSGGKSSRENSLVKSSLGGSQSRGGSAPSSAKSAAKGNPASEGGTGGRSGKTNPASTTEDVKRARAQEEIRSSDAIDITLQEIEAGWPQFLKEVQAVNHSLIAIVKHGKPLRVEGSRVLVEVGYTFHKERLEAHKNRKLIEEALLGAYSLPLHIKCEINKERAKRIKSGVEKVLTDFNVVVPGEGPVTVDKDTLIESFDGGLPMV